MTDSPDSEAAPLGPVAEAMRRKLDAAFAPSRLSIEDESEQHRGHAGHREGGESHFHVAMESAALAGLGAVERHRRVHKALAEELAGPVHALRLTLSAPES